MTPGEILAKAAESTSPSLHALVAGHLAAGRVVMAEAALRLPAAALSALDRWFVPAMEKARDAGAASALAAITDGRNDVDKAEATALLTAVLAAR